MYNRASAAHPEKCRGLNGNATEADTTNVHKRNPEIAAHAASMILILLVCLFLFPPIVLQALQDYDNSVYGLVARDLLNGGTLYRDVFDHKLPGWCLLVAGAFGIGGDRPVSINLMYLAFLTAGAWAMYGVAARAGARTWLAAAWAALFLLWPDKLDNHLQYFGSMSVHFTNAGAVIASLEAMAVWAVMGGRIASRAAAGLLMAAACLIKPQSLLLALLLGLWLALAVGGDTQARRRGIAAYAAAFALPCAAVLAWLLAAGIWPHFVEAMRYNGGYVAATPLTGGLAFLSGAVREGPDMLLVSAAAVVAFWFTMLWAKKRPDARLTLVCIWFLCGLIETVAGKRYFIHTRIVLFAPAAVLAAIAWSALQDAAEKCRPEVRRGWIAGALVLLIAITGLTRLDIRFRRTVSLWAHSMRGQSLLAEPPIGSFSNSKLLAGRWLNARTGRNDAVEVTGPAAPPVLYEAGRPLGTRFTFPFPLEGVYGGVPVAQPMEMTARFWSQWLEDMRRTRPAYLADSWGIIGQAAADGADPLIPQDALSFVSANYRRVTRAYGLDIFERKGRTSRPENLWTSPLAGPVIAAEQGGGRDFFALADGKRLLAWYSSPDRREILHAVSSDGMAWQVRRSPVLAPAGDEMSVNRPCVVRAGGQFRMWYTAQTKAGARIRGAVSGDGVKWERTGSEFPREPGEASGPSVMFDENSGVYRMFCVRSGPGASRLACAESRDGATWRERPCSFSPDKRLPWEQAIESVQVTQLDGWFYAFYTSAATPGGPRALCVARSRTGTGSWERFAWNPILTPEPETWRDDEVSAPCALRWGEGWLLFYTGHGYREAAYQIGAALCREGEFWP